MRGKNAKKINRFVSLLISQTKEEERTKTPRQMKSEVKRTFYQDRKKVIKFITSMLKYPPQ